jgi:hypothetical protein
MSAIRPVAIGFVVLLLLATIAYQYTPLRRELSRLDVLKILPNWSFFAPQPITRDTHIVVRDLLVDGTVGAWHPTSAFPAREVLHVIWHPAKRPQKILRDASRTLKLMRARTTSAAVVQCSLAYLLILHYCTGQPPRPLNAVARQFAIVETSGRESRRIWITFISEFHRF